MKRIFVCLLYVFGIIMLVVFEYHSGFDWDDYSILVCIGLPIILWPSFMLFRKTTTVLIIILLAPALFYLLYPKYYFSTVKEGSRLMEKIRVIRGNRITGKVEFINPVWAY